MHSFKQYIPYIVIAILLVILFLRKTETVTIDIPEQKGHFEVVDPEPIVLTDTILIDGKTEYVTKENPINRELLEKYTSLKDSVSKLNFVKESITERTYRETFTDSVQTITIESEVIGTLKKQKVDYTIFPQSVTVPIKKRRLEVYTGLFTSIPTVTQQNLSIGAKVSLKAPKTIYHLGTDNHRNVYLGIDFKLF